MSANPYDVELEKKKKVRIGDILEWIGHRNLAELLDKDELEVIGSDVCRDYDTDYKSTENKRKMVAKAEKLAKLQSVKKDKTFPWVNCADTVHPLTSEIILQFFSRIFAVVLKDKQTAKYKVIGKDPDGIKAAKGERLTAALSHYMLEYMDGWIKSISAMLMQLGCSNCAFSKIYRDPATNIAVVDSIPFRDFCVDNFIKSLKTCNRISQLYTLYPHEIDSEVRRHNFVPFDHNTGDAVRREEDSSDEQTSRSEDEDSPHNIIEQHRYIDLDKDGMREPYVVKVHKQTKVVLQIRACFEPKDVEIENPDKKKNDDEPELIRLSEYIKDKKDSVNEESVLITKIFITEYFSGIIALPSVDGSFHGTGLGEMAVVINEPINDVTNQILDAGTASNFQYALVTQDIDTLDKSGKIHLSPNQPWQRVKMSGVDIRQALFFPPRHEPSPVLLSLRQDFINGGKEWGGSTNLQSGAMPPGNAPVGTVTALLSQANFRTNTMAKHILMGIQEILKKIEKIFKEYPPKGFQFKDKNGEWQELTDDDLDDDGMLDVVPVADVDDLNDVLKLMKSNLLMSLLPPIQQSGGNTNKVVRRALESIGTPDVDEILPADAKPPISPEMYQIQNEIDKTVADRVNKGQDYELQRDRLQSDIFLVQQQMRKIAADIRNVETQSIKNIADAEAKEPGEQFAQYQSQLDTFRNDMKVAIGFIDHLAKIVARKAQSNESGNQIQPIPDQSGSVEGMEARPGNNTNASYGTETNPAETMGIGEQSTEIPG